MNFKITSLAFQNKHLMVLIPSQILHFLGVTLVEQAKGNIEVLKSETLRLV